MVALISVGALAGSAAAQTPIYDYSVVRQHPHDPSAFTQGLVLENGILFEGTGLYGSSSLREVDLATGTVRRRVDLAGDYFGEGVTVFQGRLFQLTWREQVGFIYDAATFARLGQWSYEGEGWGLTHDGRHLIMSDGTNRIRFLDPVSLNTVRTIDVYDQGAPVAQLNELEFIHGEIFANVWLTDWIVRIDPATGAVVGRIDMSGLLPSGTAADVLNGIAYDPGSGHLLVTGKWWPTLFEVAITGGTNRSPTAASQSITLQEDAFRDLTLVATDPDNDALTYAIVQPPSHGSLSGTLPTVRYTPAANYFGGDTFTFRAYDATAESNVADVTITVAPVNDAPVAVGEAFTTPANATLTVPAAGVLGNDTDIDSATLAAVLASGPAHGVLTLNANGSFSYTPTAGYAGSDAFTYRASDGGVMSPPATVALTITPAPPTGAPLVSLSTTALACGNRAVGSSSAPQQVRVTNRGTAALGIGSITVTGLNPQDFARTTTCGASLAAGAFCDISVTFTPTVTGTRKATLTIVDTAAGSPHLVTLTGSGKKNGR